jgi:hypothetical protein
LLQRFAINGGVKVSTYYRNLILTFGEHKDQSPIVPITFILPETSKKLFHLEVGQFDPVSFDDLLFDQREILSFKKRLRQVGRLNVQPPDAPC